jgi:phosphate acetyltransferase/phosphate butyryltransferase
MDQIENRTFDEIAVGESASLTRTLTWDDIHLFAAMSGDVNPAHVDQEFAESDFFHKIIAHGMWGASLISTLLGTVLPGPGTIYLGQTLRFRRPVALGDTIVVSVTASAKDAEPHRITFDCRCTNQQGEVVISGSAEVIAPIEKVKRPRVILPQVHLHDHGAHYRGVMALASGLAPIRVAVVHPVGRHTLLGAVEAAQAGLIVPVLVGPEARIRAIAATEGIDLAAYDVVSVAHSQAATEGAVAMARAGEVAALMVDSRHGAELMQAALAEATGLRTGRRMSHIAAIDVPTYPRLLLLTDAALNIAPTLADKRDIVQNAIDLASALGIETPRVAILSAVETVNPKIRSSVEAAAICKMVDRRQITGGMVDGPLGFDAAVSPAAAAAQGIASPVAGQADILVAPDLETGTLLIKQLEHLAEAQTADLVVGARVPIVLVSAVDTTLSTRAACAIAVVLTHYRATSLTGQQVTIGSGETPAITASR